MLRLEHGGDFAPPPAQARWTQKSLATAMREDARLDPAGLLMADAAGLHWFHWTKQHSAELGEIYVVTIDPATQGRDWAGG